MEAERKKTLVLVIACLVRGEEKPGKVIPTLIHGCARCISQGLGCLIDPFRPAEPHQLSVGLLDSEISFHPCSDGMPAQLLVRWIVRDAFPNGRCQTFAVRRRLW